MPLYKFLEACDHGTLTQIFLLNPKEVIFYSKLMFSILGVDVNVFCGKMQHISCNISCL